MQQIIIKLLALGLSFVLLSCEYKSLPVFPGAIGFGTDTLAGRGGKIIHVTNLLPYGEGSLAAALQHNGPRIIVFDVAGVITLKKELQILNPYVTIAGQTAPAPGIMLRGAGLFIRTHDVLVQHLRIRVGDSLKGPDPGSRDAIKIVGAETRNVVIDHVSMSWAIDENLSTWSGPSNITVSNSIISEGLRNSIHPKGSHSKGCLVGFNTRELSLIGNLFIHNQKRNPLIYGGSSVLLLNNLFYNCGLTAFVQISDGWQTGPSYISIIGNRFHGGPDSSLTSAIKIESDVAKGTQFYEFRNFFEGKMLISKSPHDVLVNAPPVWLTAIPLPFLSVDAKILLDNVGARVGGLDAVDQRLVNEFVSGTGSIIDSPIEVGGWPAMISTSRVFIEPSEPHADSDGDGYSNIEEKLFHLAASLTEKQ